ncbi:D-inositol-3-phosphate glycosyltransferase [bacterium BMS3Bbin04]|nr:D-inositol-3-phosphate glycosyltransferase [bacterium BMS3Bbin04]
MPEIPLRIAYVSQIRWPSEIPAGPFNANYVTSMARAGAEVHLIVRSSLHPRAKQYSDPLDVLQKEYGHTPPPGLRIHVIPTAGWRPASDPYLFFVRAGNLLKKLQREQGVNAVMSRDTRALPHLVRWRKAGLVAVHDTHNFYMDLSARDDTGRETRWKEYSRFENKCLPKLDGLIPLLDVQAQWYQKYLTGTGTGTGPCLLASADNPGVAGPCLLASADNPGVAIRAIHPGLNATTPPNPERFGRRTIGYVGTLTGIKGSMDVLEAFRDLQMNDVRLLLIGGRGTQETDAMRARIESLGMTDVAEVTGWLPVPELLKHLRTVSVALLPLTDTFYNRYLTAPSKLFDYLSQAVPVIASDLPAVRELAGDAALYVKPGDRADLTAAMSRLLEDRERYDQLADAAYRQAKTLHWDRRGEGTVAFLSELLARARRSSS